MLGFWLGYLIGSSSPSTPPQKYEPPVDRIMKVNRVISTECSTYEKYYHRCTISLEVTRCNPGWVWDTKEIGTKLIQISWVGDKGVVKSNDYGVEIRTIAADYLIMADHIVNCSI